MLELFFLFKGGIIVKVVFGLFGYFDIIKIIVVLVFFGLL